MTIYQAPLRDMQFVLQELLDVHQYSALPGFSELTPDILEAILDESAKFCQEVLQPLNAVGDQQGCTWKEGEVTTAKGFKEAYQAFVEAGWPSLTADVNYGGQGLSHAVGAAVFEMIWSSNLAWGMYHGLSHGAYAALLEAGSDEQKDMFLPKLTSGEWTGTMNLTEPHCGTDLGLIRTKAEQKEDGSYQITGNKIWISAGEHDMAENIVHLVLAKIPGSPPGVKGISLFIVPKFMVNKDGSLGARNTLQCGALEHKTGINGNATAVMNYEAATGYLVGEPNKGLAYMFVMMNAARLGVGMQGLGIAEVAYQNAVVFARDRLQGRSLTGIKAKDKPADPIIVHPDVRRMLMHMRALTEGSRALVMWVTVANDLSHVHPDQQVRKERDDLVSLLTPIIKSQLTEIGSLVANTGLQLHGGSGFTRETGVEQFVRDVRITEIYEGTNGIQGLDLVGRKLSAGMGRSLRYFFHPVLAFLAEHKGNADMKPYCKPLSIAVAQLQQATAWIAEQGLKNPDQAAAAGMDYLRMFGTVAMGYMWAQMAEKALQKLAQGDNDKAFYEAKLITAQYYMKRILPDTFAFLAKVTSGAECIMDMPEEAF